MFILDQSDSYTWPVSIELPDNGRKKAFTFDAEFKRLPQQEVEEIRQRHSIQIKRIVASMESSNEDDGLGINDAREFRRQHH